jgi:two-component system chemotaxis response regulator CheY
VRALVIDDVADMRDLLMIVLEEWQVECVPAPNGEQALKLLRSRGPFDFCTVDIQMPHMNGFDFVEEVRKNPAWKNMKLIMVTTDVDKSSVAKALSLGADEYVMKPFMRDMVESKLRLLGLLA